MRIYFCIFELTKNVSFASSNTNLNPIIECHSAFSIVMVEDVRDDATRYYWLELFKKKKKFFAVRKQLHKAKLRYNEKVRPRSKFSRAFNC